MGLRCSTHPTYFQVFRKNRSSQTIMPRVIRTAVSFVVVLVAYWVYALAVVPWIEPSATLADSGPITDRQRAAGKNLADNRLGPYKHLFPPGAWQRKSPKILDSDRVKLLMQDYRTLDDGRMEIIPCTLIFTPKKTNAEPGSADPPPIVLDAPEGAILQFDGPFDLKRIKIGRLTGGDLKGRVTIRGEGNQPGPEDNLLIITRDVHLTEQTITTPHAVDFRWGPNYGRGRQLRIKLLTDDDSEATNARGPKVTGIESVELAHIERLHLELGQSKASDRAEKKDAKEPSLLQSSSALPVEITCRGPFRFNAIKKTATFEDQVNVLRVHPDGPSDQLNCELLSVFFVERPQSSLEGVEESKGKSKKKSAGSLDLVAQRIEARGHPVILNAPSKQLEARGERLEYDLLTGRIVLEDPREVMLKHEASEIRARNLQYESAGPGRLGQIVADGPGWLRGQMAERPGEQLEARWGRQLSVRPDKERPDEGNHVISLTGGAMLSFRAIGGLEAEEIHFWLTETPPQDPSQQAELQPDRMLARNDVRVRSPEFSAAVEQMEIWFENLPPAQGSDWKAEGGKPKAEPTAQTPGQPAQPGQPAPSTVPLPNEPPAAPRRHFDVVGRLLQARLVLRDEEDPELSELTIEEGVRFVETQTAKAGERPMVITGDRLHAVDAGQPHATVTVTGRPAHFEARGLALEGSNLNLNRGTNRLWIDGPGQMLVPIDKDLQGQPLPQPGVMKVRWQERMTFDGRTARFEERVTATGTQQLLRTETLEIHFRRPISFSSDQVESEPEVEQLLCRGGVFMENTAMDETGQKSHDTMEVLDLAINLISGAMTAGGPGWLCSVHRATNEMTGEMSGEMAGADSQGLPDSSELRCLQVHFQGSITGNIRQREMTFHDRVRLAYAPADSWNTTLDLDDIESLGPEGMLMSCERLTVSQMSDPPDTWWELEAAENVVAEGQPESGTYSVQAARVTYDQRKDLMVLEGDGRSDATLSRQQQIGGPRTEAAARKIFYSPETGRLRTEGVRSGKFEGLPPGSDR